MSACSLQCVRRGQATHSHAQTSMPHVDLEAEGHSMGRMWGAAGTEIWNLPAAAACLERGSGLPGVLMLGTVSRGAACP